ncbi:MAG: YfhO family protein, partial [Lachnospiraceae bacterium]|nr:YfhO family protein [Lachnospiraceae bacterium]
MYYKNILPFGNITLFTDSPTSKILSAYYRFHMQLHNGSFSLLNPSGVNNLSMADTIPFFFCSPFTLISALFPTAYTFHALAAFNILRIGLAGLFMYLFLDHHGRNQKTGADNNPSDASFFSVFFACAYALSSSLIVQQVDYRYIDFAFLLPLLFLFFEQST